jgi:hypothetical protein
LSFGACHRGAFDGPGDCPREGLQTVENGEDESDCNQTAFHALFVFCLKRQLLQAPGCPAPRIEILSMNERSAAAGGRFARNRPSPSEFHRLKLSSHKGQNRMVVAVPSGF